MMSQQTSLPKSIASRLNNIVQSQAKNPDKQKQVTYANLLNIIASMVAATTASLLQYDAETKHSTIICEYGSQRQGILEKRSDVGERYDERDYKVFFKWLESSKHQALMLHIDQLPNSSTERRVFQRYAVYSSLYLPIFGHENAFWGYIELWESRYKRIYTDHEINDLMQASQYISQIITT